MEPVLSPPLALLSPSTLPLSSIIVFLDFNGQLHVDDAKSAFLALISLLSMGSSLQFPTGQSHLAVLLAP